MHYTVDIRYYIGQPEMYRYKFLPFPLSRLWFRYRPVVSYVCAYTPFAVAAVDFMPEKPYRISIHRSADNIM